MKIVNSVTIKTMVAKDPRPPKEARPEYSPLSLLKKIACFVEDVDSGMEDNAHQWNYLKSIFLKLQKKSKLTELEKDILELVEPIIMKYGDSDPGLSAAIDGGKLNRWTERD